MSIVLGMAGTVCGLCCAGTAVFFERRRRTRDGLPTDARSLTGFEPGSMRADSVERVMLTDAAALSFVIGVAALLVYGIVAAVADVPNPTAPVLCAIAGATFGGACAVLSRRRNWN